MSFEVSFLGGWLLASWLFSALACWRLAVGGWRLAVGFLVLWGFSLVFNETSCISELAVGGWRLASWLFSALA